MSSRNGSTLAGKKIHEQAIENAQSEGIDIGSVPNYHDQSNAKVATPDLVAAFANHKNISLAESQRRFRAQGYTLIPGPQSAPGRQAQSPAGW